MSLTHAMTLPFGVAGLALAAYCLWRLVRAIRDSVVGRWPVVERQTLELPEPGPVVLNIECPQLNYADFGVGKGSLEVSMTEVTSGATVPLTPAGVSLEIRGPVKRRRALYRFETARPGAYELLVRGLPDRKGLESCAFLVSRPLGAGFVAPIVGIIAGMMTLVLSILLPIVLR